MNRPTVGQPPNEPELCPYPEGAFAVFDERPYLREAIRVRRNTQDGWNELIGRIVQVKKSGICPRP